MYMHDNYVRIDNTYIRTHTHTHTHFRLYTLYFNYFYIVYLFKQILPVHGFKTLPTSQTVYTPMSATSPFSPVYSTHQQPIEEVNQSSRQETKTESFQMEQTGSDQSAKMVLPNEIEKFSIQQSLEIMKLESPEMGLGSSYRPHSLSIPATTPNRHQFSQEPKLDAVTSECSTTSSLNAFDTMPKCVSNQSTVCPCK